MYGFEVYGVVPDLLVLSKTLGGGVPISAVATSAAIEEECHARGFVHVTSHVSDPMPAAAARAVIDVVVEEGLAARARSRGKYLLAGLRELQERHEHIGDVRGLGLLCGVELVEDRGTREPADALGLALTDECQRCGLSINLVRGRPAARPAACVWRPRSRSPRTRSTSPSRSSTRRCTRSLSAAADVASSPGRL